jgi:cytochrome c oxidase subunit 2
MNTLFDILRSSFSGVYSAPSMDLAEPWQMGFQDPATPVLEGIIDFHNDLMILLTVIGIAVFWVLGRAVVLFEGNSNPSNVVHGTTLEMIWTIIPAVILMFVAVPSFALLYSIDEILDPAVTLKVVGHQWYWSYEYSDYSPEDGEAINFDSYMLPEDELESTANAKGALRLLEVDNRVVLPVNTHIRIIVTAADVLHCWGIPSLAMKVDACPGRLNQTSMFIKREGTFYGQCSEICGVNHGFMPIVVQGVSLDDYVTWIYGKLESSDD